MLQCNTIDRAALLLAPFFLLSWRHDFHDSHDRHDRHDCHESRLTRLFANISTFLATEYCVSADFGTYSRSIILLYVSYSTKYNKPNAPQLSIRTHWRYTQCITTIQRTNRGERKTVAAVSSTFLVFVAVSFAKHHGRGIVILLHQLG
jgi:hypothetical protein